MTRQGNEQATTVDGYTFIFRNEYITTEDGIDDVTYTVGHVRRVDGQTVDIQDAIEALGLQNCSYGAGRFFRNTSAHTTNNGQSFRIVSRKGYDR